MKGQNFANSKVYKVKVYDDISGCEPLYEDLVPRTDAFKKIYEKENWKGFERKKLRTPHFGKDCYTAPHLCSDGFTIRVDVKGIF